MENRNLLGRAALERSDVVANCQMNRQRGLVGGNSYERDLGFDALEFLRDVCRQQGRAAWLDVCCGSGKALIEAAAAVDDESLPVEIIGIDLVGMFDACSAGFPLRLMKTSVEEFQPSSKFDLITSVHGLHYLGDKLGVIAQATSWLTPTGRFVANLDAKNLRLEGRRTSNSIVRHLRNAGFCYSLRTKLLTKVGVCSLNTPFEYLGADDAAGPNYTGQPAVDSYYRVADESAST